MALPQPVINSAQGVLLTVGVISKFDRTAVVFPMGTDDGGLTPVTMCQDAVLAWEAAAMANFCACLSTDCHVSFVAAEGMMDGRVPFRKDYQAVDFPGTLPSASLPNNVTGLIAFYEDPADVVPPERTRVGKTFMPGVAATESTNDTLSGVLTALYQTLAAQIVVGFATALAGGLWYRVTGKQPSRAIAANLRRVITWVVRGYVGTQRRRLTPHS